MLRSPSFSNAHTQRTLPPLETCRYLSTLLTWRYPPAFFQPSFPVPADPTSIKGPPFSFPPPLLTALHTHGVPLPVERLWKASVLFAGLFQNDAE